MHSQPVHALIFDMDGTMVDSMATHAQSWLEFVRRRRLTVDIADLMRRTTGRNGPECMRELFQTELAEDQALALVHEKEAIYRELFSPKFAEVAGFKSFAAQAQTRALKIGVGTAGDQHNIAFVYKHLRMAQPPLVTVGGDEGLPGKPAPAIFLEVANRLGVRPENCIVFEDAPMGIEAARRAGMRAVGICTGHSATELAGPHVLAQVADFQALINSNFLETHHVVAP